MKLQPAYQLIGHHGTFRMPGGSADYEYVSYDDASARSDRVRLCRIGPNREGRLRQVNRWIDWDQNIEVRRDYTQEADDQLNEELAAEIAKDHASATVIPVPEEQEDHEPEPDREGSCKVCMRPVVAGHHGRLVPDYDRLKGKSA